jgi:aspartyl protease family protein
MRPLLVASLLIAGFAVAMPSIFTSYMEPSARPRSAASAVSDVPSRKPQGRQVEVKAGRDGHFYVVAEVNFRPVRLMVDTGATVVALRVSDAETAGIRLRDADFVNPVQTANGTTNAAEALLESVSVNDIELRNVRALVIPDDQLSVSLLGGSFLHGLRRFEVADGTLIFEN